MKWCLDRGQCRIKWPVRLPSLAWHDWSQSVSRVRTIRDQLRATKIMMFTGQWPRGTDNLPMLPTQPSFGIVVPPKHKSMTPSRREWRARAASPRLQPFDAKYWQMADCQTVSSARDSSPQTQAALANTVPIGGRGCERPFECSFRSQSRLLRQGDTCRKAGRRPTSDCGLLA